MGNIIRINNDDEKNFLWLSLCGNQYRAGRVNDLCVYYMTEAPEGSTEIGSGEVGNRTCNLFMFQCFSLIFAFINIHEYANYANKIICMFYHGMKALCLGFNLVISISSL